MATVEWESAPPFKLDFLWSKGKENMKGYASRLKEWERASALDFLFFVQYS